MPRDLLEGIEGQPRDLLAEEPAITSEVMERPKKRLPFTGATEEQWRKTPYQSAIGQIVAEAVNIPLAHFVNQLLMNYPRQITQERGYEYPEAQTLAGRGLSQAAGIAGMFFGVAPKLAAATGGRLTVAAGTRLAKRVGAGALSGAVTSGLYGQPMEERAKSAAIGAGVGGLFGLGAGVMQKGKIPKSILTKEDKFLLQKSEEISNISDKAKGSIQQEYAVFRNATKDTEVDLNELNTSVQKLFGKTAKDVEQIFPDELVRDMNTIFKEAEGSNLGLVYKTKDIVRKHIKPATWRKFKTGEQLTVDQEKLIQSYFDFDKMIDNSLEKAGMLEEKQMLDYLNKKATDLYGITGQVKKMVTDTLGKPQKTSTIQSIFLGKGDAGKKVLFNQLSEFEPEILNVTQGLQKYKNAQNMKRLLTRFGIGLGIAGATAIGGYAGGKITKELSKR